MYRYRRLVYGISSNPAIFQSVMDKILSGIKHLVCRVDTILKTGPDDETRLLTLKEVLRHLCEHNVKLNEINCSFMHDKVN